MLKLGRKQKIRLKHSMLAVCGGALLTIVLFYAQEVGLTFIGFSQLVLASSFFWLINLSILLVLISGYNQRFKDPSLSLLQMYWASSATILGFLVSHELDTLFYLLLLVITVFGIFRVVVFKFQLLCFYIVLALLAAIVFRHRHFLGENLVNDLILWSAFSVCAAILMSICGSIMRLRLRLREKNQELEQALEIKSRFLANMSHEIRTPMNGVIGMLELSLMSELDSKTKNQLEVAKSSASSLLRIINDILDFSKIEAGKLQIETEEFDLQAMINSVIGEFASKFAEKGVSCELHMVDTVPRLLKTDRIRLKQILNNLLGNAIKFTHAGRVKVCVDAEPVDCPNFSPDSDQPERISSALQQKENAVKLQITVSDTGIGIDEAYLQHLFDSFTQVDGTSTRNYGGTGLGLAITKDLCELLGGGISASSIVGEGSIFTFWITAECADHSAVTESAPQSKTANCCEGKHILVVGDNPAHSEVILQTMEALGADVDVAANGAEAVGTLVIASERHIHYDAVIMDCQMPIMDGFEASKKIRASKELGKLSELPIIALTASAMAGDKEQCMSAGMNDFLTKPLDRELLKRTLQKWLS